MSNDALIIPKMAAKEGKIAVCARLRKETVDALDRLAVETGCNRSYLIGRMVEYGLKWCRIEDIDG